MKSLLINTRDLLSPLDGQYWWCGGKFRVAILLIGLALIPWWQLRLRNGATFDQKYAMEATGSLGAEPYVYFLYYKNLYPVVTSPQSIEAYHDKSAARNLYSREGAEEILENHANALAMENLASVTVMRWGDHGRAYYFLPMAWWRGSPETPTCRPLNILLFVLSLMAVYASFWWCRNTLLGAIIVLLFGSSPFQLVEVYGRENVFGLAFTLLLILLSLHFPLCSGRRTPNWFMFIVPVISGLLVVLVRQVRSDPSVLLLSCVFIYALVPTCTWLRKGILAALLISTFFGAQACVKQYLEAKISETSQLLTEIGGHPYTGPQEYYHHFWHPLWCGLGDFDTKHGYYWDDRVAFKYAIDVLKTKYGIDVPEHDGKSWYYPDHFFDAQKYYRIHPANLPHYQDVIRDKVLSDIASDPLWFSEIVLKRVCHIATHAPPATIRVGRNAQITAPSNGILAASLLIAGMFAVAFSWQRELIAVVLFSLPLTIVPLTINAKFFSCYSCVHLMTFAVVIICLVRIVVSLYMRQTSKYLASKQSTVDRLVPEGAGQ